MKNILLANKKELLAQWVFFGDTLRDDGGVVSWINEQHPGYPYPEATGLFINLAVTLYEERNDMALLNRIRKAAAYLCRSIRENGGLGRGPYEYLFDTAVCFYALTQYVQKTSLVVEASILSRMKMFIIEMIRKRQAVTSREPPLPLRWSTVFGCHIIKALALCSLADTDFIDAVSIVDAEILPFYFSTNRFRVSAQETDTYVHANAYALEGLCLLRESFGMDYEKIIEQSLLQLASFQNDDGSLCNWYRNIQRKKVCDATIQAVRLWYFFDSLRFGKNISRGLSFILRNQSESGGIHYRPDSADINSWTSIFTLQTLYLFERGRGIKWLI